MFSSESLVNAIPIEIWRDVIGMKLGYGDRLIVNATCKEFNLGSAKKIIILAEPRKSMPYMYLKMCEQLRRQCNRYEIAIG
jgi:hypothetical protein